VSRVAVAVDRSPGAVRILRDLFGDSFRPAPVVDRERLGYFGGTVPAEAPAAYEVRRLPRCTLDAAGLAEPADGLEDAGRTDAGLLGHLRGPGPHVRGCWAADLILRRE
jgi:hypothetical protein